MGDSVSQDNIGAQYAFAPHWSDWTCRRFVQWLQQRNVTSLGGTRVAQLNRTSGVRTHLAQLRAANHTYEQMAADPILHEYMRFFMIGLAQHWDEITTAAKDVARMANRSEPAAYGNLGGGVTTNYSRPCGLMLHQHVDVIWNEDTGPLAGHRNYSASLSLKISEAAGTKPDGSGTPNWVDRFTGANVSADCTLNAVAAAEATSNDAVLAGDISAIAPGDECWQAWAAHASFVQQQIWLFTDRTRVSEAALAYSLPTVVWRHFSTISTLSTGGTWDGPAAQQTPLGRHLIWLTYAARLLDESHLSFSGQVLGHPDLMRDGPALGALTDTTKLVVLPGVDAISDAHAAALASWVRRGGHLVLLGEDSGSRDEELSPRNASAWSELRADAGRGAVTVVARALVDAALGGVSDKLPDKEAERNLTQLLQAAVGTPLLRTTAPADVYTTLWRHGGGDSAVSVDLLHFSERKGDATSPFTLRVQAPARCTSALFFSVEEPDGRPVPMTRDDSGTVEVTVPSFQVFGVIAIVAPGEREFRAAAASLRRSVNRISVAGRSLGADSQAAAAALARGAKLLAGAQGVTHDSFSPAAIAAQASEFNQTLARLTAGVSASQSAANTSLRRSGATAVRAFKFGLGRCGTCKSEATCAAGNIPVGFTHVVYNDPAWNASDGTQTHGFVARNSSAALNIGHAITAAGDGPGKFPAVPGDEIPTFYDCFYFDYFLESKPMVFRIANLSAGEYVVTLVTGSYDNCERTS